VNSYFTNAEAVEHLTGADEQTIKQFETSLVQLTKKTAELMPKFGLRSPRLGNADLTYAHCKDGDWVAGFWPGILWLSYSLTTDQKFSGAAVARRPFFQNVLDEPELQEHDLGFLFQLTSVYEYKFTGDVRAREMGLRAAEALRGRFCHIGRFIKAWKPRPYDGDVRIGLAAGKMIIDCMMNLGLLMWAYRETGVESFRDVAIAHADTSAERLVRDDFTTYHVFDFDPVTEAPIGAGTHQGYLDDSCWARGQGWALFGFSQMAKSTGNTAYRDLALKIAFKTIELMTDSTVPLWDFSIPKDEPQYVDSSAGAILANGFLLLADQVSDLDAVKLRRQAIEILKGLAESCDISNVENAEGFLNQGAAHVTAGVCDNMLPYGDYYYMEALMRVLGHKDFCWS